jgi:hypothetical protein
LATWTQVDIVNLKNSNRWLNVVYKNNTCEIHI